MQYCRDVLDLSPKNVKAMYRMGVAYHRLKDYDRALEILSSAQKLPEGASGKFMGIGTVNFKIVLSLNRIS